MCADYNRALLEITEEDGDKMKEIEGLILENCN